MSGAKEAPRRGLGRGLSALLGDPAPAARAVVEILQPGNDAHARSVEDNGKAVPSERSVRSLPVETLYPGKYQPRHTFDQAAIDDLAESVREKGILIPILARRHPSIDGAFEIIAGERRWRAAQAASLHEVPVLVREFSDQEALEIGLIENLQRQDLSPLEEAEGYRRLMEDFSHTQEALAKTVGKSRSHVANTIRLLALPEAVKELVETRQLTAGHARALLTAADPLGLAKQVVAKGLSVRQVEAMVQKTDASPKAKPDKAAVKPAAAPAAATAPKDADLVLLERELSNVLGLKVSINLVPSGEGGTLAVEYGSLEQLDDLLHRLSGGSHGRSGTMPSFGEDEPPPGLDLPIIEGEEGDVTMEDADLPTTEEDAIDPNDPLAGLGLPTGIAEDFDPNDPLAGLVVPVGVADDFDLEGDVKSERDTEFGDELA